MTQRWRRRAMGDDFAALSAVFPPTPLSTVIQDTAEPPVSAVKTTSAVKAKSPPLLLLQAHRAAALAEVRGAGLGAPSSATMGDMQAQARSANKIPPQAATPKGPPEGVLVAKAPPPQLEPPQPVAKSAPRSDPFMDLMMMLSPADQEMLVEVVAKQYHETAAAAPPAATEEPTEVAAPPLSAVPAAAQPLSERGSVGCRNS